MSRLSRREMLVAGSAAAASVNVLKANVAAPASKVALTPACMAGSSMTSVPGNPVLEASSAKAGHLTRPETSTLLSERNMLCSAAKVLRATGNEANIAQTARRVRVVIISI